MNNELDQLRDDIATLEAAQAILANDLGDSAYMQSRIDARKAKLAKLEAEAADPWKRAKESVKEFSQPCYTGGTLPEVACYARHLEDLLAKRPVVWVEGWDKKWTILPYTGEQK